MAKMNNRYDFVYFFDVQDGNPNGDPDSGNLPRIDPETAKGLVTDVCLKRKVRNYVQLAHREKSGYEIFVREKAVLNRTISEAWDGANPGQKEVKSAEEKGKAEGNARARMCEKFYDIRTFGAVLSTGEKGAGQVRGPVQLTFARSVDPVVTLEHTITRMAVTNEKDIDKERTMGRKYTIPYGLYRMHGFISAHLAEQTGFSQEDLEIFWGSLQEMFEHDHSAARGLMSARKLIVFEHKTALGSAPAADLFERVQSRRVTEGVARAFSDYEILLDNQRINALKTIVQV